MGQGPSGAAPLWAQSQAEDAVHNVSGCEHERGPSSPDLVVGSMPGQAVQVWEVEVPPRHLGQQSKEPSETSACPKLVHGRARWPLWLDGGGGERRIPWRLPLGDIGLMEEATRHNYEVQ